MFRCPICSRPVAETAKFFPFCGERCRLVDLGKWLQEDYRVSRQLDRQRNEGAELSEEEAAAPPEISDDE